MIFKIILIAGFLALALAGYCELKWQRDFKRYKDETKTRN